VGHADRRLCMWSSPLFWIVFAIVLFWAFGAYNRLMRLRAATLQAFGSLDAHMVRLVALLGEFGAAHPARGNTDPPEGTAEQELKALQGATTQLSASLAVARARPLQADAIAALAAARDVLQTSWQAALPKVKGQGEDSVSDPAAASAAAVVAEGAAAVSVLPSPWTKRWAEQAEQSSLAIAVFNEAVAQYNAAVCQFPANVLAWVVGFKVARGL
jgi:LemA protein